MKASTQSFWIVALHCAIAPLTCPAQNVTLITTYANPVPASGENFDWLRSSNVSTSLKTRAT